jgi:hypothetical protein
MDTTLRTRHSTSIVAVGFAVAAVLFPWTAPVTLAADHGVCQQQDNPRQAGHIRAADAGHSYTGVRGKLEGDVLTTCSPGNNGDGFTALWISLQADPNVACGSVPSCIMQIGVGHSLNLTEHFYYAWGRDPAYPSCSGMSARLPLATSLGNFDNLSHTYKVVYDPSSGGFWDFDIDGVQQTTFDASLLCWDVHDAYWFAEAHENGSPLGGSSANPQTISVARWQTSGSTTWQAPSWGVGNPCSNTGQLPGDHCEKSASDAIDIWTVY